MSSPQEVLANFTSSLGRAPGGNHVAVCYWQKLLDSIGEHNEYQRDWSSLAGYGRIGMLAVASDAAAHGEWDRLASLCRYAIDLHTAQE